MVQADLQLGVQHCHSSLSLQTLWAEGISWLIRSCFNLLDKTSILPGSNLFKGGNQCSCVTLPPICSNSFNEYKGSSKIGGKYVLWETMRGFQLFVFALRSIYLWIFPQNVCCFSMLASPNFSSHTLSFIRKCIMTFPTFRWTHANRDKMICNQVPSQWHTNSVWLKSFLPPERCYFYPSMWNDLYNLTLFSCVNMKPHQRSMCWVHM